MNELRNKIVINDDGVFVTRSVETIATSPFRSVMPLSAAETIVITRGNDGKYTTDIYTKAVGRDGLTKDVVIGCGELIGITKDGFMFEQKSDEVIFELTELEEEAQ